MKENVFHADDDDSGVSVNKTISPIQSGAIMYALRYANLFKNERRFRVAASVYVRKSATQGTEQTPDGRFA